MSTIHHLKAERATLHGHFSKDLPPVLTIDAGDTVCFQCLDVNWGLEPYNGVDLQRREFPERHLELDAGHALTGPVAVRQAKAGMTLQIRVDGLEVGDWGTTMAGGWSSPWNDRLGIQKQGVFHTWTFDHETQIARNQHGHSVTIRPFMGIYGMPPVEAGMHSTTPPRPTGGNIDCKELTVGSILYLPIAVDGGLFSTGDGHAAQGDGEVSVTAIECPVEKVTLTFDVVEDMPLEYPVAKTPDAWIAMGFHEDLDEALLIALENMLSLMNRLHELDRLDALALASVVVDLRVTQVVNQVKGVHAILPHGAMR